MAMRPCAFCELPCSPDHSDTFHEVTSWVHGPKLDGPKLREQTGRIAHKYCVELAVSGQAADQPKMEFE